MAKFDKTVLIAIDYDGTITKKDTIVNNKGVGIRKYALRYIREFQRIGAKFILYTTRDVQDGSLDVALSELRKHGIIPDYINTGNGKRGKSQKVNADIYIDDRAELLGINPITWFFYNIKVHLLVKKRRGANE